MSLAGIDARHEMAEPGVPIPTGFPGKPRAFSHRGHREHRV